jgi:outer membrane immunogenic protein
MKKLLIVLFLLIAVCAVFAQNPIGNGQTQFDAGFGFSNWGNPAYVGLDYGIDDFTLGGELSFDSWRENYNNNYYQHSIIGISGNANYHFNTLLEIPSNWDLYAGLNIGFYAWNSPDTYQGTHTSGLGIGGQVGTRFYFSRNFGVNLEFGGGNEFSGGKLGISVKI